MTCNEYIVLFIKKLGHLALEITKKMCKLVEFLHWSRDYRSEAPSDFNYKGGYLLNEKKF